MKTSKIEINDNKYKNATFSLPFLLLVVNWNGTPPSCFPPLCVPERDGSIELQVFFSGLLATIQCASPGAPSGHAKAKGRPRNYNISLLNNCMQKSPAISL